MDVFPSKPSESSTLSGWDETWCEGRMTQFQVKYDWKGTVTNLHGNLGSGHYAVSAVACASLQAVEGHRGVVHIFEELYSTKKNDQTCIAANQWFAMISICATKCWSWTVALSIWAKLLCQGGVTEAHVGKSSLQQPGYSRCVSPNLNALLWEHLKTPHVRRKPMILGPLILKRANVTCPQHSCNSPAWCWSPAACRLPQAWHAAIRHAAMWHTQPGRKSDYRRLFQGPKPFVLIRGKGRLVKDFQRFQAFWGIKVGTLPGASPQKVLALLTP